MGIFLDNAATSFPKPPEVYAAVEHAMRTVGVSPGRGGYHQGIEAARLVLAARESIAEFFGIVDAARVVFTHSATEALNLGLSGLLTPGVHIITTAMEHNALARPLHRAESCGVRVTWLPVDQFGRITASRIAAAMTSDTRLVAISHCSNVTGSIQPIEEIGALCRSRNILFLVDAAQSAGSLPLHVSAAAIDLLAAPGHKGLYGPQGTGFLYIGEHASPEPLYVGGTGTRSADLEPPRDLPESFECGTPNTPGIAGLGAGVDFIRRVGRETIRRHEVALLEQLLAGLAGIPGITVIGPATIQERGSVVSFTVDGQDSAEIGFHLDHKYDIAVRTGLHCAPLAHRSVGTFPIGTVRVSPGFFNTPFDIDQLLVAMRELCTDITPPH